MYFQTFGTPLEDALRRDFTINSMFYNVNDEVIEDYTGQGYSDLQSGLLRTPLEPLTTMLDDPLRALRAVRFASRYAFDLAPDLLHCMACEEVQAALVSKVSRERVGREVEGMLASARPIGALRMLHQLQLLPVVLPLPTFAPLSEVRAVAEGGNDSKRQGKASTAQAALLRFPYNQGDDSPVVDAHGTQAFQQGIKVVNALEQVFHALHGSGRALSCAAPSAAAGGEVVSGSPKPADAAAATGGDSLGAGAVGGVKRAAETPSELAALLTSTVRVVVPATDGSKDAEHSNPYAQRSETTASQSPAEKAAVRRAQQLQTARDSSAHCVDVKGEDMMSATLAATLWPVRGHLVIPPAPKKRLPKPVWGVLSVLREGLKSGNKLADGVMTAQDCAEALLPLLVQTSTSSEFTDSSRLALGVAIRNAGSLWLPALHVAVAVHALELSGGLAAVEDTPEALPEDSIAAAMDAGRSLASHAAASGLWSAWQLKPLLSGKDLMRLGAPGGSSIAQYIEQMLHWQLLHPQASTEDATVFATELIAGGSGAAADGEEQ